MKAFIDDNPKGKHGVHVYSPEDYGVVPSEVRKAFSTYLERFDIAAE
jgi:hypothetical protein